MPGNGNSNTQGARGPGAPGDPPADAELMPVVDPRSGEVSYTETRGRSQGGASSSGGERGRVPGVGGS